MANITIHKWQCDRCKAVQDEKPQWLPGCSSRYSLRANVDHGTCGGPMIAWDDLCHRCNDLVGREIDKLIEAITPKDQTNEPG